MANNTEVYRVVFNDGENHTALVFQKPVEGKSYGAGQVFNLDTATWATPNDEGNIPHREGDTDLGVTWHFQK